MQSFTFVDMRLLQIDLQTRVGSRACERFLENVPLRVSWSEEIAFGQDYLQFRADSNLGFNRLHRA